MGNTQFLQKLKNDCPEMGFLIRKRACVPPHLTFFDKKINFTCYFFHYLSEYLPISNSMNVGLFRSQSYEDNVALQRRKRKKIICLGTPKLIAFVYDFWSKTKASSFNSPRDLHLVSAPYDPLPSSLIGYYRY